MQVYSDWEKLGMIFGISLLFMIFVLLFFHFFRRYRKDKLISKIFYITIQYQKIFKIIYKKIYSK